MQLIELGEDQVGEMEGRESKILFGTCWIEVPVDTQVKMSK